MAIPDIYDLSHFNKQTENSVVSIQYINNRLEITYNDQIEYDDYFMVNSKQTELYYNIKNSSIIIDLICKGLCGFYKRDSDRWVCINDDCIVRITVKLNIYFHKINIPRGFSMTSSSNNTHFAANMKMPFIIFSNDIIEPILSFDMTKMKYIKKYIVNVQDTKYTVVYMIYKFHNMVFIYISHIIDFTTEYTVVEWDKTRKKFNYDKLSKNMLQEIYNNSDMIDFRKVIGDYKHVLVYDYR